MAKYVCDYTKVNEIARKLITASGKVSDSLKQYEPAMESTLSTWKAESKDKYIEHINGKVHTNIDKIGERLVDTANNYGGKDNISVILIDPEYEEVKKC